MASFHQVQGHLGVEEASPGGRDDEGAEPGCGGALHLGVGGRRDVALDGGAAADPGHDVVAHVLVQPLVHVSLVQAEKKELFQALFLDDLFGGF